MSTAKRYSSLIVIVFLLNSIKIHQYLYPMKRNYKNLYLVWHILNGV